MSNKALFTVAASFLALALLPVAADAQKSARVRVGVRIVESPVTEALVAAQQQVSKVAQTDTDEIAVPQHPVATESGIAHVFTERLEAEQISTPDQNAAIALIDTETEPIRVRITVAYTAN